MKPLQLALVIAFVPMSGAMVGCSSNSDSGDNPDFDPQNLTYFSLDDYRAASELTKKESVVGTWVGVTDIVYTDGNSSGPDYKVYESRLTYFVIRKKSDNDLELASCFTGGFVAIKGSVDNFVSTVSDGLYERDSENTLRVNIPTASYSNGVSLSSSGEFIKILNSAGPIGSIDWDWDVDGIDPVGDQNVYCSAIHNLEGGGVKLVVATEQKDLLSVSQQTYSFQNDIRFNDSINDLNHLSEDVPDDFVLNISSFDIHGYTFEFSILGSDINLSTAVGSGKITVTLP
jgi:hypothetical protein